MVAEIDTLEPLAEDSNMWRHSSLRIQDGYLEGQAYTYPYSGGYVVTLSFTSYPFTRDGEEQMNHVPHVAIIDDSGAVVAEPEASDSQHIGVAFTNGSTLVYDVYEDDSYIQD